MHSFKNLGLGIVGILIGWSAVAHADKGELSKYGKAFSAYGEELTIEMATFKKKNESGLNDVLLKITGPAAESADIDGAVIYHRAIHAGTGFNLQYKKSGEWRNRMACRARWGSWQACEAYFGNKTVKLHQDKEASKAVRPLHLKTAYEQASKATKKKKK